MIAIHTKLHMAMTAEFESGQDFCTMHLPPKFHHPTFTHSEVIVLTNPHINKQIPLKTSNVLRYATTFAKIAHTHRQTDKHNRAHSHFSNYRTFSGFPSGWSGHPELSTWSEDSIARWRVTRVQQDDSSTTRLNQWHACWWWLQTHTHTHTCTLQLLHKTIYKQPIPPTRFLLCYSPKLHRFPCLQSTFSGLL